MVKRAQHEMDTIKRIVVGIVTNIKPPIPNKINQIIASFNLNGISLIFLINSFIFLFQGTSSKLL